MQKFRPALLFLCAATGVVCPETPLGAQQRDYREFCLNNVDLIRQLGDGGGIEKSTPQAIDRIREQVDLYDFVLWQTRNAEFVKSLFPVPDWYRPDLYTIPSLVGYVRDKRALPHAKEYFRDQMAGGTLGGMLEDRPGSLDFDAARLLMRVGWDDPEAVQMVCDALNHTSGNKQVQIANGALLLTIPKGEEIPQALRNTIFKVIRDSDVEPWYGAQLRFTYWDGILGKPLNADEICRIFTVISEKALVDSPYEGNAYERFSIIEKALERFPADRPMPQELLELMKNHTTTHLTGGNEIGTKLLKALQERERRDYPPSKDDARPPTPNDLRQGIDGSRNEAIGGVSDTRADTKRESDPTTTGGPQQSQSGGAVYGLTVVMGVTGSVIALALLVKIASRRSKHSRS